MKAKFINKLKRADNQNPLSTEESSQPKSRLTTQIISSNNMFTSNEDIDKPFPIENNAGLSDASFDPNINELNFGHNVVVDESVKKEDDKKRMDLHALSKKNMSLRYEIRRLQKRVDERQFSVAEKDKMIEEIENQIKDTEAYLIKLENLVNQQEGSALPTRELDLGRVKINNRILKETNDKIVTLSQQYKEHNVKTEQLFEQVKEYVEAGKENEIDGFKVIRNVGSDYKNTG